MTLGDLAADSDTIARMSDQQFAEYWAALGTVVRITCHAKATPAGQPARTEINNTAASTERQWSPVRQAPANALGFRQP